MTKHTTPTTRPRGNGPGWGGPAKGAGTGTRPHIVPGPGRGHTSPAGDARRERDAKWAEEMRQLYYEVATNPRETTQNKLTAADKLLDRIEGKPKQATEISGPDGGPIQTESLLVDERPPIEQFLAEFTPREVEDSTG